MPSHREDSGLGAWTAVSVSVFVVAQFVGGDIFELSRNGRCFTLLGCNAGFFGYDALVHFLAGIMFAIFIVWLGESHPRFGFISANFWKSAVIVVALCTLIGTGWEIWEFGIDHLGSNVLRESFVLTGQLLQSGNSDTVGDEAFNLIGSVVAVVLLASFKPGTLTESRESTWAAI